MKLRKTKLIIFSQDVMNVSIFVFGFFSCKRGLIKNTKEDGLILLTMLPRCIHRLQALDVSVMRIFKCKLLH